MFSAVLLSTVILVVKIISSSESTLTLSNLYAVTTCLLSNEVIVKVSREIWEVVLPVTLFTHCRPLNYSDVSLCGRSGFYSLFVWKFIQPIVLWRLTRDIWITIMTMEVLRIINNIVDDSIVKIDRDGDIGKQQI